LSRYDLIIFDCDGTLTDSEEGYYQALCVTLEHFGYPIVDLEYYQLRYSGSVLSDILKEHFSHIGPLPEDFVKYYFSREEEFILPYTKAVPGARDVVAQLRKNFRICIASNARVDHIVAGLTKEGLIGYFEVGNIFSKDQVLLPKPAPDVFLHAAKEMGVEPSRAIVIEDSIAGVRAGKAAKMTVIGFSGSSRDSADKKRLLEESGADIVFQDWKDILIHINSL